MGLAVADGVKQFVLRNNVSQWDPSKERFCDWAKRVALDVEDSGDAGERERARYLCELVRDRVRRGIRSHLLRNGHEFPRGDCGGGLGATSCLVPISVDSPRSSERYLWENDEWNS